jgi:hypothetical protein
VKSQQVLSEELAEIEARFSSAVDGSQHDGTALSGRLVGLAFSGGGIRSATFGLGVLEALKDLGLLEKVHYLSTVSGGGYIGSWLTANCARQPGWLGRRANWDESVAHLRRYSNYLSPDLGFFSADSWSMFTVWIRNALLVQLTVILAIACVLTAPRLLIVLFANWPFVGQWRWVSILLFLFAVVGIAGNETRVARLHALGLLKARAWVWGAVFAAVCVGIAWAIGAYACFEPFAGGRVRVGVATPIALLLVAAAFFLQPVAVRIVGWFYASPPHEVNYTQTWVQGAVVVPMLATGFFVAAILWDKSLTTPEIAQLHTYGQLFLTTWQYWPFPLAIMFFSTWLLSFCGVASLKKWGWLVALIAPVVCVLVLHALLTAIMWLHAKWTVDSVVGLHRAFVFTPALVLFAFSLTIVMLIGMLGRRSTEGLREWWSRLGAWLAIYGTVWMIVALTAVFGPDGARWLFNIHPSVSFGAVATWIATVTGGLYAGNSASTDGERNGKPRVDVLHLIAVVAPFVFIAGLLVLVAVGIDQIVRLNTDDVSWSSIDSVRQWRSTFLVVSSLVLGACAAGLALMAWRIDINVFSLNAFYRNRLVRCYLGATRFETKADGTVVSHRKPQNFTGFDDRDDIPLAALTQLAQRMRATRKAAAEASTKGITDPASLGLAATKHGPLHLVNCALNLGGSSDLALHSRHSASFTLSPLHCGSSYESRTQAGGGEELGYVPTANYGGAVGAPTLGQAISVSGAAASPNMGYHTSPVVAFLLTVFNIRLGWWFPNPAIETAEENAVPSPRWNLPYLFAELFGLATDKSRFLMISDGGHFENLAIYELIKRRCAVIIGSDAECDPDLAFEGLGTLIRVCEVDLKTKIRIDVESLKPTKPSSPWSGRRCAVGTIEYPDHKPPGVLVYLKASMNGHEDTAVLQYKASHPTFPHESTSNQFYREDQFESYRALGYDITCRTFEAVNETADADKTIVDRAKKLLEVWSPELVHVDRFTGQTERLMELWRRIGASAGFSGLDTATTGSFAGGTTADRALFYLCCEMIQLMENAYLDLSLDDTWDHPDNAGWRVMFTNWSRCPAIQETWTRTRTIFGTRFQFFCNRRLGLGLPSADYEPT